MLQGRRIVVTGASSGIGRGLAQAFSSAGGRVWGVGRDPEALAQAARDCPGMVAVAADLATTEGRRAVATAIDHAGGELDVIVHAAGLLGAPGVTLDTYPETAWRDVIDINLTAVHLLHQELVAALERGTVPTVIALASTVGRVPRQGWGAYAVSKHALEGWVALLSLEWQQGRVYSVNPGGTRTPMRALAVPTEDPATVPTPAEIAPLFLRLAHPQAPEPSGAILDARDWIGRNPWDGIVTAS